MSSSNNHCLAFEHHDHKICQHQLLAAAKDLCQLRKLRLTERREQVLQILLQSHQPMGAYDILAQLNQRNVESMIAPPIVYRALEFLLTEGFIHRIECKNAFIGCMHPGHDGVAQFLICNNCDKVAELEHSQSSYQDEANNIGFTVDHSVVELTGTCADCQKNIGCQNEH